MAKKEEEYKYISEDDYKTLISVYQQKTFDLFNQNIALEAKVATLGSLVESLNETIENITKEQSRPTKTTRKPKSQTEDSIESFDDDLI
jgi:hypothetical protein